MLPTDTNGKLMSITAVVLPFVTYLLTLPRIWNANTHRTHVNVCYLHHHQQQRAFLKSSSGFRV
jgi:hypothetical protein